MKTWKKVEKEGKRKREVERRYNEEGKSGRKKRKRRSKPSRERNLGYKERWGSGGEERGRYRRQTPKGRKTSVEARKEKRGGKRRRWRE